ncbi:hypothetical protein BU26DRAFT_210270 [Trematosphaeria pertusa]|uniref:Uncharacterized protein n=1 Tax=Trematosphaeria pertusa TaxID=390896 RepID=A0A6A6IRQ1_9PLEO|nr:uncharacterized protein BU26DRAFT_210270 [Trematosphaeria pertusa]KAF2252827.1 hypothetical protein BU26DRAFT_210270 [Trematosphaeria pertusa]
MTSTAACTHDACLAARALGSPAALANPPRCLSMSSVSLGEYETSPRRACRGRIAVNQPSLSIERPHPLQPAVIPQPAAFAPESPVFHLQTPVPARSVPFARQLVRLGSSGRRRVSPLSNHCPSFANTPGRCWTLHGMSATQYTLLPYCLQQRSPAKTVRSPGPAGPAAKRASGGALLETCRSPSSASNGRLQRRIHVGKRASTTMHLDSLLPMRLQLGRLRDPDPLTLHPRRARWAHPTITLWGPAVFYYSRPAPFLFALPRPGETGYREAPESSGMLRKPSLTYAIAPTAIAIPK